MDSHWCTGQLPGREGGRAGGPRTLTDALSSLHLFQCGHHQELRRQASQTSHWRLPKQKIKQARGRIPLTLLDPPPYSLLLSCCWSFTSKGYCLSLALRFAGTAQVRQEAWWLSLPLLAGRRSRMHRGNESKTLQFSLLPPCVYLTSTFTSTER